MNHGLPATPHLPPPVSIRLRIWLLGRYAVERDGHPVARAGWRRTNARALLGMLVLAHRHQLSRDEIGNRLYPDEDPDTCGSKLNDTLLALRRVLEPDRAKGSPFRYVVQDGNCIRLCLDAGTWVDVLAFERAFMASDRPGTSIAELQEAADCYGGDLLPEESAPWCVGDRERLRLNWHGLLLHLAREQAARKQVAGAMATLQQLRTSDPVQEGAALHLMRLLAGEGRRLDALRIYDQLRDALQQELGLAPSPMLVRLADSLREGTHDQELR